MFLSAPTRASSFFQQVKNVTGATDKCEVTFFGVLSSFPLKNYVKEDWSAE